MANLVINDNGNVFQYTATAAQTNFPYPIEIFTDTDLTVYLTPVGQTPDPATDILTLTTDYTVTNAGITGGGDVVLVVPATAGDIITINRAVAQTQTVDYSVGGNFTAASINTVIDKLTVLIQQVDSKIIDRGLTYIITDQGISTGQTTIPKLGANQFWRANGSGNIASVDLTENPDVSTLRSELASQTQAAPGTDDVGMYDPRASLGQTLTAYIGTYTSPFADTISVVADPVDDTKQMRLDVGAVTTATTRVLTMPDKDIDLTPATQAAVIAGTNDNTFLTPKSLHDGSTVILQRVSVFDTAVATGTTVIPWDDTIPQNTEGDEYMTLAITPLRSDSKLLIEVTSLLSGSVAVMVIGALFRDSTANALTAAIIPMHSGGWANTINFSYIADSTATALTTFKFRSGPDGAATVTFNGGAAARRFGGVSGSNIIITEYI